MTWNHLTDRGNAAQHVRWDIVPFTLGRGLDLGCGQYKPFRHFIGIDSNKDATLFGIPATSADMIVPTCEKLDLFADGRLHRKDLDVGVLFFQERTPDRSDAQPHASWQSMRLCHPACHVPTPARPQSCLQKVDSPNYQVTRVRQEPHRNVPSAARA